jgi:FKBP-type peptidyl-prolyl cis-trans isomerase FkpA
MRFHPFALAVTAALIMLPACGTTAKPPKPVNPASLICKTETTGGLGFQVLKAGTGAKPARSDTVKVDYIGYFPKTGKVFDNGGGVEFPVAAVVPGFSEGLQMMQTGGSYRLCIPSRLGYGARPIGPIPANSNLVFHVRLISIVGR